MPDEQKNEIRILIIDDHGLFRESLARLLAAESGFEVVGQYATTDEASGVLRDRSVDVILLDFDLGDSNCVKFVQAAMERGFTGKVLVVTAGVSASQAAELVRAGVAGIFLKHDLPASLTQAIRDVVAGKVYLDQKLLRSTVSAVAAPPLPPTERERQVLSHVVEGLTNKEIADRLGVSESSVKASLQQLFSKTGVRTRSQLVRIALEEYKNQI
jgi:two-component system, NarL family, nitrate/nitrite response regulator NarL